MIARRDKFKSGKRPETLPVWVIKVGIGKSRGRGRKEGQATAEGFGARGWARSEAVAPSRHVATLPGKRGGKKKRERVRVGVVVCGVTIADPMTPTPTRGKDWTIESLGQLLENHWAKPLPTSDQAIG